MNSNWWIFFVLCFSTLCKGQDQKITEFEIDVKITPKKNTLKIIENCKITREILKYTNQVFSEAIIFSEFGEILEYNAYSIVPREGKKAKKMDVTGVHEVYTPLDELFYSTTKVLSFDYPVSEPGTQCFLSYKREITDPHFLTSFVIKHPYLVEKFKLKISIPKEVEIGFIPHNFNSIHTNFFIDTTEYEYIYTFSANHIQPTVIDEKVFASTQLFPYISTWIKSVHSEDVPLHYGRNVNDLYQWYYSIVKERLADEINQEIRDTVDLLVEGLQTNKERIDAIYNWVQSHINYYANFSGMNGFIPQTPESTFKRRRGDCKAMSLLLKGMLEYIEIPAYLTWVGTRTKDFTYSNTPTVEVDNHMICTILTDSNNLYLDATDKHLLSDEVRQDVQGKQALIGLSKDSFNIVTLPIHQIHTSLRTDTINLELDGSLLKAKINSKFNGYFYNVFMNIQEQVKSSKDKHFSKFDKYDGNCKEFTNGNWKEKNQTVYSSFNCILDKHVLKTSNKLFINLNVIDFYEMLNVNDLANRTVNVDEHFKYNRTLHLELKIPKGYQLNQELKSGLTTHSDFGLKYSFKQKNNRLILDLELQLNFITLKANQFANYAVFLDHLHELKKMKIVFEKNE